MATGASDGWRMNRRLSIGSTGATAWSKWPLAKPLDLTPANAPTPVGCSDASVTVLPVPFVDHVFNSFRSGQHYTGNYTDGLFSIPSDLPVLRVGGPARSVFT